jgi:hypothetical protein
MHVGERLRREVDLDAHDGHCRELVFGPGDRACRGQRGRASRAHLILNVFGLVGLVIAGTLPYFAATQVRSKMSPRATPTAMRAAVLGLAAATAVAATGQILDRHGVVAGGLIG